VNPEKKLPETRPKARRSGVPAPCLWIWLRRPPFWRRRDGLRVLESSRAQAASEELSMTEPYIFVSTSIPYVNGPPHVGFAWELVIADVLARYHRARGRPVRFITGTDDNSLKNVRAAEAEGTATADFVRARGERFLGLCRALNLSNDDFIRTAFDPRHAPAVHALWRACDAAGDIYSSAYRGDYCVGCEQFYSRHDLPGGRCPEHETPLEQIEETNHFFKLSRHQAHVAGLLSSGALRLWPSVYEAESLGWVRAGLADFSISRSRERARGWGVAVPGEDGQIVYVWFDALVNYVSALGYGSEPSDLGPVWRDAARRIHVIGKNVTRFHCVYWPAILESAGLPPPTDVVVHGFLTVEGRKIGKSLGNGVDPFVLVDNFGADRLRHYLLRGFSLGNDGDFSVAGLTHASSDELSDQLGNLLSRVLVLLEQNTGGQIPALCAGSSALEGRARACTEQVIEALEHGDPHEAIGSVFGLVRAQNLEIARVEPWRLARRARATSDTEERAGLLGQVEHCLGDAARGLIWTAALLEPFLPETAQRVAGALGAVLPAVYRAPAPDWSTLGAGAVTRRGEVLFERLTA
jgi:methionyl-tRNA synthetase